MGPYTAARISSVTISARVRQWRVCNRAAPLVARLARTPPSCHQSGRAEGRARVRGRSRRLQQRIAHVPKSAHAMEGASGHARAILLLSVSSSPGFSLWLPALGALGVTSIGAGGSVGGLLPDATSAPRCRAPPRQAVCELRGVGFERVWGLCAGERMRGGARRRTPDGRRMDSQHVK